MEMFNLGLTWGEFGILLGAIALCVLAACAVVAVFGGEADE